MVRCTLLAALGLANGCVVSSLRPDLHVDGTALVSDTSPLRIELDGWTIQAPRRQGRQVRVEARRERASGDLDGARLQVVFQYAPRPLTPDDVLDLTFARIDQSNYQGTRRERSRIGRVESVELSTTVSGISPLVIAVAVHGDLILVLNCSGASDGCREVIAGTRWTP